MHFATADLLGDSNLLSNAIQSVVLGTQPGVALHMSRQAGIVAVRMDMDQSQFPSDVSPAQRAAVPGIYDKLIPILQQWKQQYDFVGSYYINIGDKPTAADPSTTNWTVSLPYYQAILAMGERDRHPLLHPPHQSADHDGHGDHRRRYAGRLDHDHADRVPPSPASRSACSSAASNLGANTPLPGAAGEGGAVANTQVTAVSGNTITISYVPGGYGTANDGTIGDIPAGTTLTFSIPAENTNFLQTGTTARS